MSTLFVLPSKFIQDKYDGYSQKEAAYIAGAVYDSSLVLSASVGILIVSATAFFYLFKRFYRDHLCKALEV